MARVFGPFFTETLQYCELVQYSTGASGVGHRIPAGVTEGIFCIICIA